MRKRRHDSDVSVVADDTGEVAVIVSQTVTERIPEDQIEQLRAICAPDPDPRVEALRAAELRRREENAIRAATRTEDL